MKSGTREKLRVFIKIGAAALAVIIFLGYILSSFLFH